MLYLNFYIKLKSTSLMDHRRQHQPHTDRQKRTAVNTVAIAAIGTVATTAIHETALVPTPTIQQSTAIHLAKRQTVHHRQNLISQ